ncbi:glucose-methanol-choline oxidoreductase, partial [Infundibulicybe gibba]
HRSDGINSVTLSGFPSPTNRWVTNASAELGRLQFNPDYNSGSELGLGWVQLTASERMRSSSSSAYLAPSFLARLNLHVVVGVEVSRAIETGVKGDCRHSSSTPRAVCPLAIVQLTASKEVAPSVGAASTPHILLNSEIGDTQALKSAGVTPLVNLSNVGENLSNHPFSVAAFTVLSNNMIDTQW